MSYSQVSLFWEKCHNCFENSIKRGENDIPEVRNYQSDEEKLSMYSREEERNMLANGSLKIIGYCYIGSSGI